MNIVTTYLPIYLRYISLELAIWQHTLVSGFMPHIAEILTKLATPMICLYTDW